MSTTSEKKTSRTNKRKNGTNNIKKNSTSNRGKKSYKKSTQRKHVDFALKNEAMLIAILAIAVFTFLCVIPVIQGTAANLIRNAMFGMFGILAYLIPIIVFLGFAFGISNKGNTVAILKIISTIVLLFLVGIIAYVAFGQEKYVVSGEILSSLYTSSRDNKNGGGVIFGILGYGSVKLVGIWGTLFIAIVLGIICLVFISERSFISGVKKGSNLLINAAREEHQRRKEYFDNLEYEEVVEESDDDIEETRETPLVNFSEPKLRRLDKKFKGVSDVTLDKKKENNKKSNIHEITLEKNDLPNITSDKEDIHIYPDNFEIKPAVKSFIEQNSLKEPVLDDLITSEETSNELEKEEIISKMPEPVTENTVKESHPKKEVKERNVEEENIKSVESNLENSFDEKKYIFPPLSLLSKGEKGKSDSSIALKETAYKLQQTLKNFGVDVTVTDISQGPTVTRFELQPEQGVKVSKIKSLEDDIKLNLASTDIRIEAPIPGKAAVGIEVPNKENSSVALRDLLESKEFKNSTANLTFAVGKDIGGQVVVTDIAKMPHLLIAGATGSGKSVCINTIIMSLLYKSNPNDVKMIMIDPKVVELSVYNDIPHLLIPVVTDPKKASAALQWAVNEMSDRYQKFAEGNVRDLKGYNKLAESGKLDEAGNPLKKMPQLVIIVDELADLMMVASNEVEESICRLAQLARAAGIHLIIATQRPSVDVITGLIKANMPSRIAFSVSSGVDSRTILDMNGAEKLLGKGDMLFYPQGFSKPARVQGAFVSDSEVSEVVDFIKNQRLGNINNDIADKINASAKNGGNANNDSSSSSEYDQYFVEAGKFIIEKDKASIGMLQRVYKIGFNRAARIMDQLESVGVVSAEDGTKPRKVLMSLEQFEEVLEEVI